LPNPIPFGQSHQNRSQQRQGKQGRHAEKHRAKRIAAAGQQPERRAGIADVGEAKKIRDEGNRLMESHRLRDPVFRGLIEDDHSDSDQR